jgi:hypothetical protein
MSPISRSPARRSSITSSPEVNSFELYKAARIFVAAIARRWPGQEWPISGRLFALAVDRLQDRQIPFVQQFRTCDRSTGRACDDYEMMLRTAMSAGLVSYLSPEFTHFKCELSPRAANVLVSRGITEEELVGAEMLAEEILKG